MTQVKFVDLTKEELISLREDVLNELSKLHDKTVASITKDDIAKLKRAYKKFKPKMKEYFKHKDDLYKVLEELSEKYDNLKDYHFIEKAGLLYDFHRIP